MSTDGTNYFTITDRPDSGVRGGGTVTGGVKYSETDPNLPSDEEHQAWVSGYVCGILAMHGQLLGGADAKGVRASAHAAGISIALAKACGVEGSDIDVLRRCGVRERALVSAQAVAP